MKFNFIWITQPNGEQKGAFISKDSRPQLKDFLQPGETAKIIGDIEITGEQEHMVQDFYIER
jgi:hypothetical protein